MKRNIPQTIKPTRKKKISVSIPEISTDSRRNAIVPTVADKIITKNRRKANPANIFGTEEEHHKNRRGKAPKKTRPDATYRPFAGYVWDSDSQVAKWNESALLRRDGYSTLPAYLENCPDSLLDYLE